MPRAKRAGLKRVRFQAQRQVGLHGTHVAKLVQRIGPGVAVELQVDLRVERPVVGRVVGRVDGDLLALPASSSQSASTKVPLKSPGKRG